MRKYLPVVLIIAGLSLLSSSKTQRVYYNEALRPQYHFTPEKNFMGNPSGLIFYEDEFHLFYQYNPEGKKDTNYHWGHTVSTDLIHWKNLPVAVTPDQHETGIENCAALPGSVVIDDKNILGLQKGDHKTMVIFYTSWHCGQRMAYSTDRGRSWSKFSGNPVIPFNENDDARDPRVLFHQPTGKWIMVLSRKLDNDDRKRGFSFYTSTDLVKWEYQSHLAGFKGSPDIIELRVNNRPDDTRWIIFEATGNYIVGSFNGSQFIPESIRLKNDFSSDYFASQTWNNIPVKDGRCLQIALLKDGEWEDMPFSNQLTFPGELSLKKINSGIFLIKQPAHEIETLYGKKYSWKNKNLIPGINQNLVKGIEGECLRIKGRFDLKTCESFGFMLRVGKKNQGTELVYNVKRGTLSILGQTIPLEPVDNKIFLDILLDRASVELFANNGRVAFSANFKNQANDKKYILFNTGGELLVEELDIWEINSAWSEEPLKK
jgi:fructan beta-fructosidase